MITIPVTKSIFFVTNEKKNISQKDLKLTPPRCKPLVIMTTWLMAADKHIFKYANFYCRHGLEVLNVKIDLWQLLWPVRGTQILAADILKFLENNRNTTPIVVHGFSVGCYLWGEVLVKILANKPRYQFVIDNVVGQIWDSPADIMEIPTGVSIAAFPNSNFLQNSLKSYAIYHLETFDKAATVHYMKSRSTVYDNPIRTPILVLASKMDPVSSEDTVRSISEYWESIGLKVYLKMWDDSAHVGHMLKYPKQYLCELTWYLTHIGVIRNNNLKANL